MATIVTPRVLSGFPEFDPAEQVTLDSIKRLIQRWYERYGFVPLETPAVEPKEILASKGAIDKQIYAVSRLVGERELQAFIDASLAAGALANPVGLVENYSPAGFGIAADDSAEVQALKIVRELVRRSQTDMALHFDLTVPLAHYVAKHKEKLTFPFRRYQIQKVWRGERPQSGRFREFYQCDIDVIGRGELSLLVDAEIPSIIYQIFKEMNIGRFVIRISNAKILEAYLRSAGVPGQCLTRARSAIDNLEKVGVGRTVTDLVTVADITQEKAREIIAFFSSQDTTDQLLKNLNALSVSDRFAQGVRELEEVVRGIRMFGVPDEYFRVDLTIARGLDYYTGTVYETTLTDHPGIGSICSGGRYDDLASYFTDETFPGVGISIGLTRLLSRLLSAEIVKAEKATTASVLVTTMDRSRIPDYLKIATDLREAGVDTEVYMDDAPLGKQLRYANRKGFLIAIIAGEREFANQGAQIKNLVVGGGQEYPLVDVVENVKYLLQLIKEDRR